MFWRKVNSELALYLHQKRPVAVVIEDANAVMLTIIDLSAPGAGQADAAATFGANMKLIEEIKQNQLLSDGEDSSTEDEVTEE